MMMTRNYLQARALADAGFAVEVRLEAFDQHRQRAVFYIGSGVQCETSTGAPYELLEKAGEVCLLVPNTTEHRHATVNRAFAEHDNPDLPEQPVDRAPPGFSLTGDAP